MLVHRLRRWPNIKPALLNPLPAEFTSFIFTNLKLCLATATTTSSKWKLLIFVWFEVNNWQAVMFNPFKPKFTIVIFIHYKSRIALPILDM